MDSIPVNYLSRWLGHSSMQLTLIYLEIVPDPSWSLDAMLQLLLKRVELMAQRTELGLPFCGFWPRYLGWRFCVVNTAFAQSDAN